MKSKLGRLVCWALATTAVVAAAGPQWRQLETKGDVTPSHGSAIGFHPSSRRIVLFGGIAPTQKEAEYRLVAAEWSLEPDAPLFWRRLDATGARPGGLIRPAAAYDPAADRLLIFGGAEDSAAMRLRNDVHVLNHASGTTGEPVWSKLEPAGSAPENRAGAQAVLLADGAELLVFGGCTRGPYGCDFHQNDVWLLSGFGGGTGTPQWTRLEIRGMPPEGRSFHSVTLCPGSDSVVVFGGSGTKSWNDTWILKFAEARRPGIWERLSIQVSRPPGRASHAAGCLPSEHALVIFGGTRVSGPASDVWLLRPLGGAASPRWEKISIPDPHPAPRETAHLIVDQKTGLVLVTGGTGIGQSFSDSWVLDLGPSSGWGEP